MASQSQIMEDNRKQGTRDQDSTSSTRVNRWAKPEKQAKNNDTYDMGHQMQREKPFRNQRDENEEEEILENYKYTGGQGKHIVKPMREEERYAVEAYPVEERRRSNPFINPEVLSQKDNSFRGAQPRESSSRPLNQKETPQKAYGLLFLFFYF